VDHSLQGGVSYRNSQGSYAPDCINPFSTAHTTGVCGDATSPAESCSHSANFLVGFVAMSFAFGFAEDDEAGDADGQPAVAPRNTAAQSHDVPVKEHTLEELVGKDAISSVALPFSSSPSNAATRSRHCLSI